MNERQGLRRAALSELALRGYHVDMLRSAGFSDGGLRASQAEATGEAERILAGAEPRQEQGHSGHWPGGRPNRAWIAERFCYDESGFLGGTAALAHEALAEALAAWIDQ